MLKKIILKNFPIFTDNTVNFGPGLNVIVGNNGTGKTRLMKISNCLLNAVRRRPNTGSEIQYTLYESYFAIYYTLNFPPNFEPNTKYKEKDHSYEVYTDYFEMEHSIDTPISTQLFKTATIIDKKSVFIPNKEILTFSYLFSELDFDAVKEFEITYLDILKIIDLPPLKATPYSELVTEIEGLIGGKVKRIDDRFYIINNEGIRFMCNIVSDGYKKLATLAYLLKNGSLNKKITLFWDEPEANLNPTLIRKLASILTILATNGFQIVLATHSLFLMKELHLLSKETKPVHYIGLIKENDSVRVTEADDLDDLELIESLEAELDQSIRYLNR